MKKVKSLLSPLAATAILRKWHDLSNIAHIAGGPGSKTSPPTRPAKTAIVADAAQLQNFCGPMLNSLMKPVDKRMKPTRPAKNPQPRNLASHRRRTRKGSCSSHASRNLAHHRRPPVPQSHRRPMLLCRGTAPPWPLRRRASPSVWAWQCGILEQEARQLALGSREGRRCCSRLTAWAPAAHQGSRMEAADRAELFGWHSSMAVPEDGGRRRRALTGRRTGGRPGAPKSGNEDSNFSTSVTICFTECLTESLK